MNLSYVERIQPKPILKGFDAFANRLRGYTDNALPRKRYFLYKAAQVIQLSEKISLLDTSLLKVEIATYRSLAARRKLTGRDLLFATAIIREASFRSLKMSPYKVQIAAALSIQHNCIAEMATGEGKSLTAAIAAVLIGWQGKGCHLMTSNHYLAGRDAIEFEPFFTFCGLTVAAISEESQDQERRQAYLADVTYCTNKGVAADFLRDQLSMGPKQTSGRMLLNKINGKKDHTEPILRGLEYAIVDEADSVMIDDGVTPLLISSESGNKEDELMYCTARDLCQKMDSEHYKIIENALIELTKKGKSFIEHASANKSGVWAHKRRREELVIQALKAQHLFFNDKQYIIDEGKVIIVDQQTGRTMPDRSWRNGMHQAIEAKENLEISPAKDTCARISFQKFFRLYRSLGGMTGTASEAASEFYTYYNLPVVRIPTHKKCQRKFIGHSISINEEKKWQRITKTITQWHQKNRPILVGTASIKESELISQKLEAMEIPHQILNAKNHQEESQIIAQAGHSGKITVATSMAGRGTDIKLNQSSKENGGLLVITTQLYHSQRVDRQLQGRCSRQGDPGAVKCFYSLEDEILKQNFSLTRHLLAPFTFLPSFMLLPFFKMAQFLSSSKGRQQRKQVMKSDDWLDETLGFTGEGFR
jgi:preprotein translocase subunit SecA